MISPPPSRNVQFDALRGMAILSVMVHHAAPKLEDALSLPLGWAGVRFFFVLSGFLITGILLQGRDLIREGGQSAPFTLRQFYLRRCLRIFPIFYLTLFILALCDAGEVRDFFFWHFAYLSNFRFILDGYYHDWVGHFWTLTVEEQFYLVWPAVIFFAPRRLLGLVILLFVALGVAYRYYAVENDFSSIACEANPLACVDNLAAGALAALLLYESRTSRGWYIFYAIAGWIGVAGLAADILLPDELATVERFIVLPLALSLFAIGVIAWAARGYKGILGRVLEWQPLVYVGVISYGLYVYHAVVQSFLEFVLGSETFYLPGAFMQAVISFSGSFVLAILSWHFIEKPINRFKRFVPYQRPALVESDGLAVPMNS